MINNALAFIVYNRPHTTKKVFEAIRQAQPPRLYLIADGPKSPELEPNCLEVRKIVETGIDWNCELISVYSDTNLGLAKRVQTGLDHVFSKEKAAIVLEDDTLPDNSFFSFCENLLSKYEHDERIVHISGCNLHPEAFHGNSSYCFSSIINVWGWATWARSWRNFDLEMKDWKKENKKRFLKHWFPSNKHKNGMHRMFDLHCENKDPWTWDYQWVYSCLKNRGLSVMPSSNLVSNIGIGPDATNTISTEKIEMFPQKINQIFYPLIHPEVSRNIEFEKGYYSMESPKLFSSLRNYLKKLFGISFGLRS